ncbi:cytidylyltransferase [Aspergillus karnatakaensis]|uniref:nicotinate-nicotinamide nucleotide adenylyltransferase n=1 Tax=Aspergillus karnatakaensis TaxID=1810916 RepID=UPI003CCDEAAE
MESTFQSLRAEYASALKRFDESPKNFEIIASVPDEPRAASPVEEALYVLDSSFNPPTLAHRRIASSAIKDHPRRPSRLLLLLATQNADKPSKPASFEDRLIMMMLFAQDLREFLKSELSAADHEFIPPVDVAVTKKPYFVDKAAEVESASIYPPSLEQVHLTGYDTLIRIFNTKYYPPEHTLAPLKPFLSKHRLRVTMRPDSEWGGKAKQEAYLDDLAQGRRDSEGAQREWAQRICLVEGKRPEEPSISSTKARKAMETNIEDLDWLVPGKVRDFIFLSQPYSV